MIKKLLLIFLILVSCTREPIYTTATQTNQLSIISFNIQVLGRTKISNPQIASIIIDIIDDYDLIAIQELRDNTDFTLVELKRLMPEHYKIIAGPREGRSSSKEQAVYIYDDRVLDFISEYNYEDLSDIFERSPYIGIFETDDKKLSFQIVNVHISPGSAKSELTYLAILSSQLITKHQKEVVIVGDFNADGSYFPEQDLLTLFSDEIYNIVIGNELNTTVAVSNNTYDRIITSDKLPIKIIQSGVLYFENYLTPNITTKQISDHYPVYMVFEY